MANLQIKGIDPDLYESIKRAAAQEERSLSQQVLHLIKQHLSRQGEREASSAEVLLRLAGSWEDDRPSEQIIQELKSSRTPARPIPEL